MHHIILDARINGTPAKLVLDTGSSMCALDSDWASALGLESGKSAQAVGTDSLNISLATMDSLELGPDVVLRNVPAALGPLREVSERFGRVIHGTVGWPLFMQYVVEIDYASRVILLHDPSTFAYHGTGERIPLDLSKRVPVLRAEFVAGGETIPVRLLLDLGTGGYAAILTKPFVDQHAESLGAGQCVERALGAGMGGSVHGRVTALNALRLGSLNVPNPYVAVPETDRGFFGVTWVDGTLGAPVMSRTRLILDYPRHEVIIEPVTAMDAPFAIDQSGLSFRADGADLDTVVIAEVVDGSPAARAGIAVGDVLRSVNGRAISGASIDWVAEVLTQAGATHSLRVEREVPLALR